MEIFDTTFFGVLVSIFVILGILVLSGIILASIFGYLWFKSIKRKVEHGVDEASELVVHIKQSLKKSFVGRMLAGRHTDATHRKK